MSIELQDVVMTAAEVWPRTILLAEVGSTVHGVAIEGTDDRDEIGACIEPPSHVIGLKHFENLVQRDRAPGERSQPGDLDRTTYSLRKLCSLALKGNPSILLPLMAPDEKCAVLTTIGRALRAQRDMFVSKKAGNAYLGYMQQQRERLMGERGQMKVKRPELVDAYGYDTKYAGQLIRLGFQGIDYMAEGSFPVPMPRHQAAVVLDIRQGKVGLQDVLDLARDLEADLMDAIERSPHPERPDYDAVNVFLVAAYGAFWEERGEWG